MRILPIVAACSLLSISAGAQYKKASFLKRSGRTYEIGARGSFITQAHCFQPAVAISFGRDKEESRFFNWHDIEVTLGAKYSYNTTYYDYNSQGEIIKPVKVTAKTKSGGLLYRFNLGYYLADNANEDNKVLPFVNLGASALIYPGTQYGAYETDVADFSGDLVKRPENDLTLSLGFNAGAGAVFKVNGWLGFKATAGYNIQINTSDIAASVDDNLTANYMPYKSHPYVSFGIRFRVAKSDR